MSALARDLALAGPGWQLYTPTFAVTGGGIGNGTVTGMWRRVGDSVQIVCRVTFGSTSTFGSGGAFSVSLPSGLTRDSTKILSSSDFVPGSVFLLDATAHANDVEGFIECAAGSSTVTFKPTKSTGAAVNNTVPFTWADADVINLAATIPVTGW